MSEQEQQAVGKDRRRHLGPAVLNIYIPMCTYISYLMTTLNQSSLGDKK